MSREDLLSAVRSARVRGEATGLWHRLTDAGRLTIVAGPCVIESEALCLRVAEHVRAVCERLGMVYVFKASFDKANRTSGASFRGPGLRRGLRVLAKVRARVGVPVLTDIHGESQAGEVAEGADILQIPALLCRQTDLVEAAVRTGRVVNLKKGQFLAPEDMAAVVRKAEAAGGRQLLITERGTTFGYHNLVVDMRAIPVMGALGYPVLLDVTHAVQLPGAGGDCSGGQRQFAAVLARAGIAAGASGLFLETHPRPEEARSDGPAMVRLAEVGTLLSQVKRIYEAIS